MEMVGNHEIITLNHFLQTPFKNLKCCPYPYIAARMTKKTEFLQKHAVVPGTEASLEENLPFNQTLTLSINKTKVTLGFAAAHYIFGELSK